MLEGLHRVFNIADDLDMETRNNAVEADKDHNEKSNALLERHRGGGIMLKKNKVKYKETDTTSAWPPSDQKWPEV